MLSPKAATNEALVPHSVFDSMYDNVMFPMQTLYCPPVPPSMLMGRYKPPPRPGPTYRNDLSIAGAREHWAQTQVARMWRGILTRRRLRNERNYFEVRTRRAIMIQCWWRRLRAIWRRRALQKILDEWVVNRRETMVAERLRDYGTMMTWQRKRFEDAVIKVQRVYRWYRSNRINLFEEEGTKEKEKLPFPLKRRKKVYFPWRRRATPKQALSEGLQSTSDSRSMHSKSRKSSLQFRKHRHYPQPPSVEEAKVINDAMRAREAQREATLAQPEVQDRMQWKRDGLRENDFDHNAGLIQRFVRYKWNGLEKETRKITTDYFNAKVSTIQRAFRVFKTLRLINQRAAGMERRANLKNEAYARAKLAEIREEGAWQSKLLDSAARTIQMHWAHYMYKKQQSNPFREEEPTDTSEGDDITITTTEETPSVKAAAAEAAAEAKRKAAEKEARAAIPPPYGLLKEHIGREHAIRDAGRTKMEKEMEEAQKNIRRSKRRYVPTEIITVSGEGLYLEGNVERKSDSGEM
ncbi:uncharacterized protein TM35_000032330 [Trypanosoma theileri]|uniref:Uncharacterized protein n=1 Tax=Trypanosoma theileri TaxID=67003 RepID=A0A1X0P7R9_9TRYP|nr:uncharacterized protein TM35_000032330 [Trypanosoma theileri]ORC92480.1 hypothetical protein TM35_000032330 [Trypanosoma theileri]